MTEPTNADLHQALGRVEAKLDILIERDADKEKRVRTLEQHRNWMAGLGAALAMLGFFPKG